MRRALPGLVAILVAAGLAGCGGASEPSDLTKTDVVRKLTANPPPDGIKRLTKATCDDDGEDKYQCDVVTEDDDSIKLGVEASGDRILITGVENQ
jgi:hypothetical protein